MKEELNLFTKQVGLDDTYVFSNKYKKIKKEMYSNLLLFMDNYLLCGGHHYIYLLVPLSDGSYRIIEKENMQTWKDSYWKKEDPEHKRNWSYFDEDINDLFDYILHEFDKNNK